MRIKTFKEIIIELSVRCSVGVVMIIIAIIVEKEKHSGIKSEPRMYSGSGSAFALLNNGTYMSAKHVTEGCSDVYILHKSENEDEPVSIKATYVDNSPYSDISIIYTYDKNSNNPAPLKIYPPKSGPDKRIVLRSNYAYGVGYPQGKEGQLQLKKIKEGVLHTFNSLEEKKHAEPVLYWALQKQSITGPINGISGGPVVDTNSNVVGNLFIHNPRKGRVTTSTPESIAFESERQNLSLTNQFWYKANDYIHNGNYNEYAQDMRDSNTVVKVMCKV